MLQRKRGVRDRQIRLVLGVTLAAHAGAAASIPWPGSAGAVASAIGIACIVTGYLCRPDFCRIASSRGRDRE
jgi:hypothetical protein